jgi:hypothetical protein
MTKTCVYAFAFVFPVNVVANVERLLDEDGQFVGMSQSGLCRQDE